MVVTDATFHVDTSPLKTDELLKALSRVVTREVSHHDKSPPTKASVS